MIVLDIDGLGWFHRSTRDHREALLVVDDELPGLTLELYAPHRSIRDPITRFVQLFVASQP